MIPLSLPATRGFTVLCGQEGERAGDCDST